LLDLLYVTLILAAFPWFLWSAVRKGKYREGFAAKFLGLVPQREADCRCIWLHAVSVGEVNLLAPLLAALARCRPKWECVVSTTTMTGMALARKKYPGHLVFYCPLDFSWAVRAAMRRIRPDVLLLAETELWPNLIRSAREAGARVAVVNGRLSDHSFRGYRRIRPLVARLLRQIDLVAVQDEMYADRFRCLGARPQTIAVTGSMKYDGAQTDRSNPASERLQRLAGFAPDDVVFLAGSTQEPEEAAALATFLALRDAWPRLRLVLVPRHPDRFESVARLLDDSGLPWQRRSTLTEDARPTCFEPERLQYDSPGQRPGNRDGEGSFALKGHNGPADISPLQGLHGLGGPPTQGDALGCPIRALQASGFAENVGSVTNSTTVPRCSPLSTQSSAPSPQPLAPSPQSRILFVDTVGELGAWWGTAHVAFVGGSFGNRGGQNMIEPAAYGAAVCFGPNTWNFRDIVATMLDRQAAVTVHTPEELTDFVRRCLAEPDYAAALGDHARDLVARQLGATERTLGHLISLVEAKPVASQRGPPAA